MAINFNEIPGAGNRLPLFMIEFDSTRAGTGDESLRALMIGQKTATGSAAAGEPVQVASAGNAATFFGAGSMLSAMVAAYRRQDPIGELWAVPLDDIATGTAATKTVTVTAASATAGAIALYIAGRRVQIAISAGQTATVIATAIVTAVTAVGDLPVTAAAAAGVVTLTARHKGTLGTELKVEHSVRPSEALPSGVTLAIANGVDGASDPDIADVWTAIGDEQFHVLAVPYTADAEMDKVDAELAERWGPLRQNEGHACAAITGTAAEATTYGNARNSPHVTVMDAGVSPTPTYEWAAAVAGVVARYGSIDPARPFQTLPLKGVVGDAVSARRLTVERNTLLHDGIATHTVDRDGTVRVERLVTTYQTAPGGVSDTAYLDLNTVLTLGYLRRDFRGIIRRKYPRHKLGNDNTRIGPEQRIMTPSQGRNEAIAAFGLWEEQGLVEDAEQFKEGLICERNADDPNRLDWLIPPNLINQFRVGGAQIQFLL